MWLEQGDLQRAQSWLAAAVRRVPAFAPAHGYLADIEAARGEADAAIARLRLLTIAADDPDYAARLGRVLRDAGQMVEAGSWRARAAARFEELCARHPEAFADHAAEFWLTVGGDPTRALDLARLNLDVRPTTRARALLTRAADERRCP